LRAAYREEYGIDLPDAVPETVNLRMTAQGAPGAGVAHRFPAMAQAPAPPATTQELRAIALHNGSRADVPVLRGWAPKDGVQRGPAVIESGGATAWVPEGFSIQAQPGGWIRIFSGEA